MRKLIGFALIALALALTGLSSFAMTKQHTSQVATAPTEIKGQVTHIMGHTLTVKDEAKFFLETLIDNFPRSEEAKTAREKLKELSG